MKISALITAVLPLLLACKPMPVSADGGDADMTALPRLYRDINGELRDRLLDNQRCDFGARDIDCARRCFPSEPIFPACGSDGTQYYYTRQGLFSRIRFGAIRTLQDPRCGGVNSYSLTLLTPERPQKAVVCGRPDLDFSANLFDREWYLPMRPDIEPAKVTDENP